MSKARDELCNRISDLLAQHGAQWECMNDDEALEILDSFIDGLEQDVIGPLWLEI